MPSSSEPSTNPKEIEAIKTDLAALRVAIDLVRAHYEEKMEAIRDGLKGIIAEASSGNDAETMELTEEVKDIEVKMKMLESQAGGLEMALDRYTALVMEEVKGADGQGKEAEQEVSRQQEKESVPPR